MVAAPLALAPPQALGPIIIPDGPCTALVPVDPAAPRLKELTPGCELRIIVDDDKHARVRLVPDPSQAAAPARSAAGEPLQKRPKQQFSNTAEIFGAELVPGQEYPLLGGTRTAIYTWHGCRVQISGPTFQEYDAPNVCMKDYLGCAAVLEQRRQRADGLDLPAPRVLVCGSSFSGKSSLCQVLCNYAMRREHTPIFVDLDPRYSSVRQLQGLPGCVCAMPVEHPVDEEPPRRLAYFFGHIDWSDNQRLYERVVSHLSRVVVTKMNHATTPEGARVGSSGVVVNAPNQPTPELLQKIIEMFEIDVIFVLDNETLESTLTAMYRDCPRINGVPKVEVVPLPKSGGVQQASLKRIRHLRALRVRDYFHGVMRDFHPYSVLVDLADVQLVQIEEQSLSASMLPIGQESRKAIEFIVRPFVGQTHQLENALLAVVRANSMNEVLYAPMCGFVLVTKVEEQALQLLCPAPPPLPAQYLLVGDYRNLKFIDI